ncbi:MAG: branched-chain amino acid transport system permease protein [Actinomycetota bacterium]|nr:branched-chain amino acid transport system permease protein [Actinomycetota bacterium]
MALLLQIVVTGLAAGAVYGLVAVAISLIYTLTGVIHFALGEMMGAAILVTLYVASGLDIVTRTNVPGVRYALALACGVGVATLLGALSYSVLIRPFLTRGSLMGWVGATVALAFALRGLLEATLVRQSYVLPDVIPYERIHSGGVISLGGGTTIPLRAFFIIACGIALAVLASWFLERTRAGTGLRAVAEDRLAAELAGVSVHRSLLLAFALAGAFAGVAALIVAPGSAISVNTGSLLGLKGLVAALVGSFVLPRRVFVAGLALGVFESAIANFHIGPIVLGPGYADVLPLAVALLAAAFLKQSAREVVE